jgi:hypothetical protein
MEARYDLDVPNGMSGSFRPLPMPDFPMLPRLGKGYVRNGSFLSGYELSRLPCIAHFLGHGHKVKDELWVPISKK